MREGEEENVQRIAKNMYFSPCLEERVLRFFYFLLFCFVSDKALLYNPGCL